MRRIAVIAAIVVLAGCGDGSGNKVEPAKAVAAPVSSAAAATGWDLVIKDDKTKAFTDWTAWLLERGYPYRIIEQGGERQVIAGPFPTRAVAEEKKALLADRQKMDSDIVEHVPQP